MDLGTGGNYVEYESLGLSWNNHGCDCAAFGAKTVAYLCQGPGAFGKEFESWRDQGGTHFILGAMDTARRSISTRSKHFERA